MIWPFPPSFALGGLFSEILLLAADREVCLLISILSRSSVLTLSLSKAIELSKKLILLRTLTTSERQSYWSGRRTSFFRQSLTHGIHSQSTLVISALASPFDAITPAFVLHWCPQFEVELFGEQVFGFGFKSPNKGG